MHKFLFSILTFYIMQNAAAQMPGSGNALYFDGINDIVSIPNSASTNNGVNFTITAWVNIAEMPTSLNENIIFAKGLNGNGFRLSVYDNDGVKQIYFTGRINTAPFTQFNVSYNINSSILNKWIHIAATKNATSAGLYINGILASTDNSPAASITVPNDGNPITIGNYGSNIFKPFKGNIDELRYFNTTLQQSDIRETMCKKIAPSDVLFGNLNAYYTFDQSTGTTLTDQTANANDGLLQNNPTWLTSSAPIGNFIGYSYDAAENYYCNIAHPLRGDKFNAILTSNTATTASGIHIYGITEYPNTLNGTQGVGTNNAYYGVFVVNNNNAEYNAGYSFQNLGTMLPANLNDLQLYKRDNNASTLWTNANAVFSGTSCTAYGQNTEYILGSIGSVLPIQFLNLNGKTLGTHNLLNWEVAEQVNVQNYVIEKSSDKIQWQTVGSVIVHPKNHYQFIDNLPSTASLVYYRIKRINSNNNYSFSNTISLMASTNKLAILIPNVTRTNTILYINNNSLLNTNANLYSADGKMIQRMVIKNNVTSIAISHLPKGMYWLQISTGEVLRLIKE